MARPPGLSPVDRPERRAYSRTAVVVLGMLGVWGVVARVWLLRSQFGRVTSDEAIVGLMARHMRDGEFSVFFWGQPYGGPHEAALTAVIGLPFGHAPLAVKIVPLLLNVVAAVLLWRVALRATRCRDAALLAAGIFWAGSVAVTTLSVRGFGFYAATLVLTLAALLLALQLDSEHGTPWRWAAFGFVVGQGVWCSPHFVWVAAPAALWLLIRQRRAALNNAARVAIGCLVGGAPWFVWNATHDWASLSQRQVEATDNSYLDHVREFVTTGLPVVLGVKIPPDGTPAITNSALRLLLYAAIVAMLAFGIARIGARRGSLFALGIVAFPFLLALSKLSFMQADGRYVALLFPLLAIAAASAIVAAPHRIGSVAVALLLPVFGWLVYTDHLVARNDGRAVLVAELERLGVNHGFAEYWLAYNLTFASDERVTLTSFYPDRYPPFTDRARRAREPASFVFEPGGLLEQTFRAQLDQQRVAYRRVQTYPRMVVYLPAVQVRPEIGPGLARFTAVVSTASP
jgi:hypothetical protein